MQSAKDAKDSNTGCLIILIILIITALSMWVYNLWLHDLYKGLL